ncbi:glycosyltransferase family 25 protein [Neisseria shayeganii]|uniref:Lacto-N-neotetraose biosynthesis glycosyl transferase LgtE n=1 Tax=Neisseria shayeganii 871 TaxID=1032488 RepID=G4CKK6_9NEIS|nr:glycosyltransferase family 25 protein [Neisseria shayeganii]EGY51682.1 lacto-N-neotetraose biosynthesis glycosyl transferase LgtE [Neisseria shayeganii 871]
MLHNHVISLSHAHTRRSHIRQEFGRQQIPFHFFDALTPADLTSVAPRLLPNVQASLLSPIEQACLMSHVSLWQRCLDEDLPYIAIFEDDIFLGKQADAFLTRSGWLHALQPQHQAFAVHLETVYQACRCSASRIPPHAGRALLRLRSFHYGAGAYILSQAAARWLLAYVRRLPAQDVDPVDAILFDHLVSSRPLAVYQMQPALCIQDIILHPATQQQFGSQMEAERAKQPKPKAQRTLRHKLQREIGRLRRKWHRFRYRNLPLQTIPFE